MACLNTFIILLLAIIFFEDIKSRSVHWFLFPALAISLMLSNYLQAGLLNAQFNTIINLMFLALQLAILTIYFSMRYGRTINIFKELLGLGDVLYLVALACYFSLVNYILFYVFSLITVLIIWLVIRIFSNAKDKYIPLAGIQAALFAILFTANWIWPSVNLADDSHLFNLIGS